MHPNEGHGDDQQNSRKGRELAAQKQAGAREMCLKCQRQGNGGSRRICKERVEGPNEGRVLATAMGLAKSGTE